jgi:superfamily II DNA or RNA helicase
MSGATGQARRRAERLILRPYQARDADRLRAAFRQGRKRICYAAPTGSGKTVLFVYIAGRAVELDNHVGVVVHRQELVDQAGDALAAAGVPFGVVAAGYPENLDAPVQVAMVQTLVNRLDRLHGVDLLIC